MSKHTDKPEQIMPLRHQAEAQIREGAPPRATHRWSTGVEALTLLHGLASAPASANDALKLLHELQIYQVELDLQQEQMELSQQELAKDLYRYVELYNFVPVAYFVVDIGGKIIHANLAANQLFDSHADDLSGKRVDSLLSPASRRALSEVWKRLSRGTPRETCEVQTERGDHGLRTWQAIASASPDGQSFLLVLQIKFSPNPLAAGH